MLNQAVAGIVYEDVERLIYKTIHEFIRQHGGDFDELRSKAGVCFVRAYETHNETRGAFTTWLRFHLWHGFLDDVRVNCSRARRHEAIEDLSSLAAPREFSWRQFSLELGEDAQEVLRLVFDDNAPKIIVREAENRGGKPKDIRTTLRDYLSGMGWTAERIKESFQEIREALK